jgi:hypothetical protein
VAEAWLRSSSGSDDRIGKTQAQEVHKGSDDNAWGERILAHRLG